MKDVLRPHGSNKKTSGFAYGPLINPLPSLSKISYKYNSMLTYIPVSFLFSFILGFGLGLKIGLGLG